MKNIILFSLILTVFSCSSSSKQTDETIIIDTIQQVSKFQTIDRTKYYATEDTVFIETEIDATLIYSKEEFNQIVDNNPQFFEKSPYNPVTTFHCNVGKDFVSEAFIDKYFILYAFFLKQRNGIEKYKQQRKQLIDIYLNINSLFQHFSGGGSLYTHQYYRILGHAEYSVYKFQFSEPERYDISAQKELYIKSLRQLIEDEVDDNKEKPKRMKELNKIVDNLDKLITNKFYLREAQEYHYENYD